MQRVSAVAVVVVAVVLGGGEVEAAHRSIRQLFPESGPDCSNGRQCIPIRSCPVFVRLLENPTPEGIKMLQESHCGFAGDRSPLTCCPDGDSGKPTSSNIDFRPTVSPSRPIPIPTSSPTSPPTRPPTRPPTQPTTTQLPASGGDLLPSECGFSSAGQTRIFFGEDSPLGAYPWIALLGYTSRFQPQVVWGCGGSLINSRYVVTASHCTAEEFTFNRDLTVIRLGEHNLSTEIDCESRGGRRTCAPPHQTFTPVEIIRHSDFNSRGTVSDDIALIRLDKEVEFNAFVGPICIPPPTTDLTTFLGNRQAFVAGWGATERGPDTQILQQVRIPFVSRDECNPHYNNALLPEQVCFGGDGRRDSCFGDSGGPVVAPAPGGSFLLLALVSFGQPSCGVEGVPAVYTSMAAYRSWILENIKP
ncbi:phenoloxidase-activating factor 1-like isoform X2 [Portunus trituberculatus]|uniref:phenoloxidase-activating factor 1-like isoform X2 n=1 Tax=Portunus trituberculatus TaxID=210409 RepID=UPI001E1D07BB|nr:phenoloxidase-activating factor 1-like isoform X2 [Portunus trituberculatus]